MHNRLGGAVWLLTIIFLLAGSGCFSDNRQEVERLQSEIENLQSELATKESALAKRQREVPDTLNTAPTPAHRVWPTVAAYPGMGICDRTPAVQWAILEALQISSCQLATPPELYRIEALGIHGPNNRVVDYQPGDFRDLPNLWILNIRACGEIPPDLFNDLVMLSELRVGVKSEESIQIALASHRKAVGKPIQVDIGHPC